jgi:PAS domain S-box-containing protein
MPAAVDSGSALAAKQRRMTTSLAYVLLAGPVPALVWLALPHRANADELGMLVVCAMAWLGGAALLAWPARLASEWALGGLMACATVLISVGIYFTGMPDSAFVLLFLWAAPYSFFFFTGRHAALQTAWFAACYVAVLTVHEDARGVTVVEFRGEEPALWLLAVGTVVVVGLLVRQLAAWMQSDEARFRRGFEDSHLGMALIATDLRYLDVNDAMCTMLGRSRKALIGSRVDDHGHPDDIKPSYDAVLAGITQEGGRPRFEKRYLRPDGTTVPARVNVTLIRSPAGRGLYYFTVAEDITERRSSEEALARRTRRLDAVALVSQAALTAGTTETLMHDAVAAVAEALAAETCSILRLVPGTEDLVPVASHGWSDARFSPASWASDTLRADGAIRLSAGAPHMGVSLTGFPGDEPSPGGIAVAIRGPEGPFGVMTVQGRGRRAFDEDDMVFTEAVARILGIAVQRQAGAGAAEPHCC